MNLFNQERLKVCLSLDLIILKCLKALPPKMSLRKKKLWLPFDTICHNGFSGVSLKILHACIGKSDNRLFYTPKAIALGHTKNGTVQYLPFCTMQAIGRIWGYFHTKVPLNSLGDHSTKCHECYDSNPYLGVELPP